MPYIPSERAETLDSRQDLERNPGELNYTFSSVAANYIFNHGLSYQTLNDISGALTEALAEFRRRIVVPYEDFQLRFGDDPYVEVRPEASEPDSAWVERLKD